MLRPRRLILLVPLAALLLGLCYLSFAWSAKGSDGARASDPRLAHPVSELRFAMARIRAGTKPQDREITAKVSRAIRLAPLEEEPFILAGLARFNAGDYDGADTALEVARRRNPRSREALFLSADVALAAGDIRSAVESLEIALRIAPQQQKLPQEAIILLTSDADAGRAALAALRTDTMKSEALIALARSGASSSRLLDAIKLTRAPKALASNPGGISAITRPLIDAADFEGAFRVWSALLLAPPSPRALIRNPRFEGTLPSPFGWDILSGADGFAEAQSDGLVGEAYGRRSTPLARQLLMLAPGVYRLEVEVELANELIETVVLCAPATEIARSAIAQEGVVSTSITVPAGCKGQWLEVRARASDPPRAGAFHLRSIRILGAGE